MVFNLMSIHLWKIVLTAFLKNYKSIPKVDVNKYVNQVSRWMKNVPISKGSCSTRAPKSEALS